jgi:hypothetical protein
LDVLQGQEGVRLLVVPVEDDEFTVGSHHGLHLSSVVDDQRATQAGILIFIHAHIAVIRVELALVAWVGEIRIGYKPIVILVI